MIGPSLARGKMLDAGAGGGAGGPLKYLVWYPDLL